MKYSLIILLMFLTIVGCETKNVDSKILTVNLSKSEGEGFVFNPGYTDLHFKSNYLYSDYYRNEFSSYEDYNSKDSIFITEYFSNSAFLLHYLYKNNYLTTEEFKSKYKYNTTDTTNFSSYDINNFRLVAQTSINDSTQRVIVDANTNNLFSDDKIQYFKTDFKNSASNNFKVLDTLPVYDYSYNFVNKKGKLEKYNRKIIVYPSVDTYHIQFMPDEKNKKLHLVGKFKDYWQGKIEYNSESYDVFFQGFAKDYFQIVIKPDSLKFVSNDFQSNHRFEYQLNDTLKFSEDYFRIDSLNMNKIFFTKLKKDINYHGFRIGENFKNQTIDGIYNDSVRIEPNTKKKLYLIDFWGTWCSPCIKDTPKLIELNKKFETLEIISIAFDETKIQVQNYVKKNSLNWKHGYVPRLEDTKNTIIGKMRINEYPTYLLLDENFKIIWRYTGSNGLNQIEKLIESSLNE
jgi:thiol-disulfide isomerase/thioredoxin